MATGGFFSSDLFSIYRVVQNTHILYAKELLVSTMREYFAKDTKYHYVQDPWGFPKIPDHTNLHPEAGINDDATTRIYIGQENKFDIRYYPCALVKHTGSSYKPISFNQDRNCIQQEPRLYIDGYGREYLTYVPKHFLFVGAWDSTFDIDIMAEGIQDRATISEATAMLFQNIAYWDLLQAGLFIKNVRVGGESAEEYMNDKIFKQTVSLECRGEYRRIIPINSIVETISICIEVGNIDNNAYDPNLEINYKFDLLDVAFQ